MASRHGTAIWAKTMASSTPTIRAFSTTLAIRAAPPKPQPVDATPAPVRRNPLVGNYVPRAPEPKLPVSTDHPRSPRPPTSSAEVPPNIARPDGSTPAPPPPPRLPTAKPGESLTDAIAGKLGEPAQKTHRYDASSSNSASLPVDVLAIVSGKAAQYGRSAEIANPLSHPKLRTKAVLGRTVFVKAHSGPTAAQTPSMAFKVLDRMVKSEGIRNKSHSQRFHERPGIRKKRLKSSRWRARFKDGFKETVNRVLELKRQGW